MPAIKAFHVRTISQIIFVIKDRYGFLCIETITLRKLVKDFKEETEPGGKVLHRSFVTRRLSHPEHRGSERALRGIVSLYLTSNLIDMHFFMTVPYNVRYNV